jgi:hypothetical protein
MGWCTISISEQEKGFIVDGWMEGDRSLSIKIYGARIGDLGQPSL